MSKLDEARNLLAELRVPAKQQTDVCCYVILAMANIAENTPWRYASNNFIRIHDILLFTDSTYGVKYAENSRETFRKQAIQHFLHAAFIETNNLATNSPNFRYRLTDEMIKLICSFNTPAWKREKKAFLKNHHSLIELYASKKLMNQIPANINGAEKSFSTGSHNELQKAIIEEFAPRFAPNSRCLYVGDTADKDLVKDEKQLKALGFEITLHDKMPDVVLYSDEKEWIYFIEAAASVGTMEPKRIFEIEKMTEKVNIGKIYVTAFLDFKTYKKFAETLAWETEVWIAEMPEHMIHLNGDRFLGPR